MDVELLQYTVCNYGLESAKSLMVFNKWKRREVFDYISNKLFEGKHFEIDQETDSAILLKGSGVILMLMKTSIVDRALTKYLH
ncbi:DUF4258 domain-containing protein (plasmid) [Sporosarcina sp. ANT_H38]